MIELQGKLFAPIHDLQGNIAALLPFDEAMPTFYRYSAFGEEKIEGDAISPWRFSSKRSDQATGLVYYGRRFYSPQLGRWLTPDPSGFVDGMNLYAFVHNDPLTHFDEYGLVMTSYRPVEQIVGPRQQAPWEGQISAFGRYLGAKATHELYDFVYAPLGSFRETFRPILPAQHSWLFSTQPWHERYVSERQSIDRFFGTNITNQELARSSIFERYNLQMQNLWLPPPGGGVALMEGAAKTTNAARHSFDAVARLSQAWKLSRQNGVVLPSNSAKFKGPEWRFPENPNDFLRELPRGRRGCVYPAENMRIRIEQYPLQPGEVYSPRHHGQHYHVEVFRDPSMKNWNKSKNIEILKPPGYRPGSSTGFLPGEFFPGIE